MEINKNNLSKKRQRNNDKNMPSYTKEDKLKYSTKNELLKKKKAIKEDKKKTSQKINKLNDNSLSDEDYKNQSSEHQLNSINNNIQEEIDNQIIETENINPEYEKYKKLNKKLIIVLEGATLELGNLQKNPQILNCDEHYKQIKSMKKNLEDYRPDIIHQSLLSLFDSPLNKVGLLQVYIHTNKNIVIKINPKTRIPRTFKRFSGLFTQLLLKNEIKVNDTNETLLKVINLKIEDVLGKKIPKILLSEKGRLVDIDIFCKNLNGSYSGKNNNDICFIIGTNPKGNIEDFIKYNDDCIALSSFELDSNVVSAKICDSFENVWNIL